MANCQHIRIIRRQPSRYHTATLLGGPAWCFWVRKFTSSLLILAWQRYIYRQWNNSLPAFLLSCSLRALIVCPSYLTNQSHWLPSSGTPSPWLPISSPLGNNQKKARNVPIFSAEYNLWMRREVAILADDAWKLLQWVESAAISGTCTLRLAAHWPKVVC